MADTISASALEATTESQTTDATQSEAPATTPATPELVPTNTSEAEFQLATTIPAPQLDPALVASLTPATVPASPAQPTAITAEVENSLTTAPIEPASQEAIPAASIPRDMFQPAPTDALPASSLVSSTQSGTDDAESLMAAAAAALEEMAMETSPTASQPSSPTTDSTVETPAKPAAGDTPAIASTASAQNETAVQAQPEPQITAVEAPIAPAELASVSASAPEPVSTKETSAQPGDSLSSTPIAAAPAETSAAIPMPSTPVADTIAFEAERQFTSTASATGSESIKSEYAVAVQSDLFPVPQSTAPLQTSAPAATENQNVSAQTVISPSAFERTCIEVAKLMFGENGATEMNLRLVRAALERANVHSTLNGPTDLSC
jgi:hypothetical protein